MNVRYLFVSLLMALCCAACDGETAPVGPALPETSVPPGSSEPAAPAAAEYAGTVVMLPAPPHSDDEPALPGLVLGLRTADGDYILTVGGRWLTDCEVVLGGCALVLEPGDEVAVTGVVTEVEVAGVEYGELEIETIDRI